MKKNCFVWLSISFCLLCMLCGCGEKEDPLKFREYHPVEISESVEGTEDSLVESTEEKKVTTEVIDSCVDSEPFSEEADSLTNADPEYNDGSVIVDYASELMYYNPDSYYELILDHSAYATQLGFEAVGQVTDFRVYSLSLHEASEEGITFDAQEVYYLPELTSDKSLVVSFLLGEVLPVIGISYVDSDGQRIEQGVSVSGYDTSILLEDIEITNRFDSVE